jgi:LmbE family N-acetylglucosaminyl deacetylase
MANILVVAAHPDDELLGLGGTVKKHFDKGDNVICVIVSQGISSRGLSDIENEIALTNLNDNLTSATDLIGYFKVIRLNLPDNRLDSIDLLDVIKKLEEIILEFEPNIVFTHYNNDLNIDHQIVSKAVLTACRPIKGSTIEKLYFFETPSSTEWNFIESNYKPNYFVDITLTIETKLKAMKIYNSEIRKFPHPRSIEALDAIARKWGSVVGYEYAEAFMLVYEKN